MSRFTMTLAAAAASAVAAIAAVALPAVGADSKTPRKQAKPDGDFAAFVACLRSHGLADAPADPVALKPWLAGQGDLRSRLREGRHGGLRRQACRPRKRDVVQGPDIEGARRLRPRPRPRRAHRAGRVQALGGREGRQRSRRAGRRHARLQDGPGPGPSEGPGKPGACVNDVRPADEAAKRRRRERDAAKPGT